MSLVAKLSIFLIVITSSNGELTTPALKLPLLRSLNFSASCIGGGYDFISVTHRRPIFNKSETNDLSTAMVAWIPWFSNFSITFSFQIPKIVLVLPRNSSEFILNLKTIGSYLNEKKETWKTWSPSFFIYWPILVNGRNGLNPETELLKTLRKMNVHFRMDCDVYILLFSDGDGAYTISGNTIKVYEIYTLEKKLQLQQIILQGYKYFTFSNYLSKVVRRHNFHRALIRPVVFNDPDYESQTNVSIMPDGTVELMSSLSSSIFTTLEYALNFSYRIVLSDGWIEQDKNGTWSGMAKQLLSFDADISINLSTLLAYRFIEFDFLHAIGSSHIQAFFRQPKARTIRDILINPLDFWLWVSIMAMWTLAVFSIGIIYFLRQRYVFVEKRDKELFDESLLWIVSTFCQKGWYTCPATASLKVVFLTATVFGLVTFITFSAALVPVLSIQLLPIKTLVDLGKSELQILEDIWLPSSETKVKEIESYRSNYVKLKKEEQFIEIDNAIPQLLKGDTAFITFTDGFLSVFHRHNHSDIEYCSNFYSIPLKETTETSGFTTKKGSQYKEIFNHKLLMIKEIGILSRSLRAYRLIIQPNCNRKGYLESGERNTYNTLGILDVATAYFILGGGVALSLLDVTIEYFIMRIQKK